MLLEQEHQKFEMSGVNKPKHFAAKQGGKLFSILSDKLYSNKIAAVIRELSTNAYEIHQVCGKEGEPFTVKLPSWLDSNFSIRDYGTGLTEEQIDEVYTVFFESTKDNSNELGGAFGLGSKTPFAYVDSFVVNSFIGGYKHSYFFIKDKEGCPSYTLASKVASTEPSGLEICIAVNKNDIGTFCSTAKDVYTYFKHHPNVIGNSNYTPPVKKIPKLTGDKWEYYDNSHGPVAVMGNIAYALNNFPNPNKFLINGIVLYFEIGEISPNPNRETLSFDKQTIDNINARLKSIESVIQKNIEDKIAGCKNFLEAAIEARSLNGTFNLSTVKYDGVNVIGRIDFPTDSTTKIQEEEMVIVHRKQPIETRKSYNPGHYTPTSMPIFYVDDLTRGGVARIKLADKSKYSYVDNWYCKEADVEKFKRNLLLKDDQLTYTSTLPKPVYASRSSGNSHKTKVMELTSGNTSATYCWTDAEEDLEDGEGYYVEISSNKIVYNGKDIHPCYVHPIAKQMGVKIFGVKTVAIKKLGDGWENGIDKIKGDAILLLNANTKLFDDEQTRLSVERNYTRFWSNLKQIRTKFKQSNYLTDLYDNYVKLENGSTSNKLTLQNLKEIQRFLLEISTITQYNGVADKKKVDEVEKISKSFPLLNAWVDSPSELFYYCSYIIEKGR